MKVVLDTNALTIAYQFKIDIFKELEKKVPNPEYITLKSVIRELEKIQDKKASKMAMQLIKKYEIKIIDEKGKTDNALSEYSKDNNAVLFTNDKELRTKAKKEGVKIAFMRKKKSNSSGGNALNLVKRIEPGANINSIKAVVEIPKGSSNKYEYDEKYDCFKLDRSLHSSMIFPFEYGFIPKTKAEDGDALDIIILTEKPTFPGCLVTVRVIGLLKMEDEKGYDYKIISVPINKIEPRKSKIKSINDLEEHIRKEVLNFMEDYKKLEPHKWVKVMGFGDAKEALSAIKKAKEKFEKEVS